MASTGMPQLDIATYPTQLFWLAVTFIVLYLVMRYIGVPRVGGAIEARRGKLEADLDRAGRMKAEAEAVLAAYQKTLNGARAEAQSKIKEANERLAAEAAERQRGLGEKLAQDIAAAERDIAAAKERALADIRGVAGDLAQAIADRLAGTGADLQEPAGGADRGTGGRPL